MPMIGDMPAPLLPTNAWGGFRTHPATDVIEREDTLGDSLHVQEIPHNRKLFGMRRGRLTAARSGIITS